MYLGVSLASVGQVTTGGAQAGREAFECKVRDEEEVEEEVEEEEKVEDVEEVETR